MCFCVCIYITWLYVGRTWLHVSAELSGHIIVDCVFVEHVYVLPNMSMCL